MTESTPDPLWDGEGADAELDELTALLAPYRATTELPPLPRRGASVPVRWALGLAAALLIAVGGAALFNATDEPGVDIAPGDQPSHSGTTGAALDVDPESSARGRARRGAGRGADGEPAEDDSSSPMPSSSDDAAPTDDVDDGGLRLPGDEAGTDEPIGSDALAPRRPRTTFIFYEDAMGLSANPVHERTMADVRLNELIHLALYAPNYADQPQGVLAESAALDDSGRVLTIKLGAMKWSDGEPVVADDVVFTLQTYKDPASRSLDRHRWDFISNAEAPDPKTVVLTLARTYPEPPISQLYLKVMPQHAFTSTEVNYNHRYRTSPVTAGPFRVAKKDHKNWILKRNDAGSRASKLKEVRCQEVPEKRTQAELMSYEYGHAMIEVEPQQRAELDADQCCTLKPYPSKSWWFTGFNQTNPHLADSKVRAAMSLALDRQEALHLIGEGELISGPFTLSSRYYNHEVPVPVQDLASATALMEEAGYAKAGGYWSKEGDTVDLRFFYDEALGAQAQTVATNLVGQLKKFGIKVSNPAAIGGESWEERILRKHDFDLVMGTWSFDVNEDIGQLFGTGGARNFVGFDDDHINRLLAGAYASDDPLEQQAAMKEVHRRLAETRPYVFLWSLRNFSAVSWDLQGAHLQAFYYFTQLPDWSLRPR